MTAARSEPVFQRLAQATGRFLLGDPSVGYEPLPNRILAPLERAAALRSQRRFCGTYVGITGSYGKSTTTAVTAQLLGLYGSTSEGVYWNNARGVRTALRRLRVPADYFVQEVSGHYPGAIQRSLARLRVDIAVVTTVGLDHYTAFRTPEAVAAEKAQLVELVSASGVACLNADDPQVAAMASRAPGRVVLFGRSPSADVRAENVACRWPSRLSFDLVVGDRRWPVQTRFVGAIMLNNLLAALSVLHALGLDLAPAVARLAETEPQMRRLMVVESGPEAHTYVVDTFKASLSATRLLVGDLDAWGDVRKIFVLGTMSDTGNDTSRKYRGVLRDLAARCALVIGYDRAAGPAESLARSGLANVLPAASLRQVQALLEREPPSLVILKSKIGSRLEALLPPDERVLDVWRKGGAVDVRARGFRATGSSS